MGLLLGSTLGACSSSDDGDDGPKKPHLGGEAPAWPHRPVVGYDDLTALAAAPMVLDLENVSEAYNVIIMGFGDYQGNPVKPFFADGISKTIGATPNAIHLLSIGGDAYHFTDDGIDATSIAQVVVANGLDGVSFDIEIVDNTITAEAWLTKVQGQIADLRTQLTTALGHAPILGLAPAVVISGDIGSLTLDQPQVVARSDLPLTSWITAGLFDAVVLQAYNGIAAERNPEIVGSVYEAAMADTTFSGTRVVVGIPVSPGGTYDGQWGAFQLWNGETQCPGSQADVDAIASSIVKQVATFGAGHGLSGWALQIDADPSAYNASNCPTLPYHSAGYFTDNVANQIAKVPPPSALYVQDHMGVAFSCSGTAVGDTPTLIPGTSDLTAADTVDCTDPVDKTTLTYNGTSWSASSAKVTCAPWGGSSNTALGTLCEFNPTTLTLADKSSASFTCNGQAVAAAQPTVVSGTEDLSTTTFSCTNSSSTTFTYAGATGWSSNAPFGAVTCGAIGADGTTCTFEPSCRPYTVQSGQWCSVIAGDACPGGGAWNVVLFEGSDCTTNVDETFCSKLAIGQVIYYDCGS